MGDYLMTTCMSPSFIKSTLICPRNSISDLVQCFRSAVRKISSLCFFVGLLENLEPIKEKLVALVAIWERYTLRQEFVLPSTHKEQKLAADGLVPSRVLWCVEVEEHGVGPRSILLFEASRPVEFEPGEYVWVHLPIGCPDLLGIFNAKTAIYVRPEPRLNILLKPLVVRMH